MNLIEQLGGYEKASKHCDKEVKDGGYPYDLISELLEYRRQNNIYEIGDKVFEKADGQFGILEITAISDSSATACNDVLHSTYGLSECSLSYYVRHATDEEIAAGRRL